MYVGCISDTHSNQVLVIYMKETTKKVCMAGDSAVGKTSLVRRFVKGTYNEDYKSTLGTVLYKKTVYLRDEKADVKLILWDISGQAEFKRTHRSGFKDAAGALVICDLTREETIDNIKTWIKNFHTYSKENAPVVILANKFDLIDGKDGEDMVKERCQDLDYQILTTSAKTGYNVEEGFKELAKSVLHSSSSSSDSKRTKGSDDRILRGQIPEEREGDGRAGEIPECFSNSSELIDFTMNRFCDVLGDEEMGMYIFRKQVDDMDLDFEELSKSEAKYLMNSLTNIIKDDFGRETARDFKRELLKAYKRWDEW